MPVSCYPGFLFLVFFLLVGVLWDTPGTGVSSSQWSTSPVCLFLLFLSFPANGQFFPTPPPTPWEGWGPCFQRLGEGDAGVSSQSSSDTCVSYQTKLGSAHPTCSKANLPNQVEGKEIIALIARVASRGHEQLQGRDWKDCGRMGSRGMCLARAQALTGWWRGNRVMLQESQ